MKATVGARDWRTCCASQAHPGVAGEEVEQGLQQYGFVRAEEPPDGGRLLEHWSIRVTMPGRDRFQIVDHAVDDG